MSHERERIYGFWPNGTASHIPPDRCTIDTCPLTESHFKYRVNLAANAFFMAFFAVLIFVQLGLGVRKKTWSYMVGMVLGLGLEVLGYAYRVVMNTNPFTLTPFTVSLIGLTMAPAFFSACVYIAIGHALAVYNTDLSRLTPKEWSTFFVTGDIISLIIQGIGGAIAATYAGKNAKLTSDGTKVMVAGLSAQVFFTCIFIVLCVDYAVKVRKNPDKLQPRYSELRASKFWKAFLASIGVTVFCIFTRSVYRCAELSGGFKSDLAQDQNAFIGLEGVLICIAALCLTICHPGLAFKGFYNETAFVKPKKEVESGDGTETPTSEKEKDDVSIKEISTEVEGRA